MDDEEKLRAIESRDGSYDWRFWYGVKSTGIVCRPSCSARVPARKNIVLFDTLEDAIQGRLQAVQSVPQGTVSAEAPRLRQHRALRLVRGE